MVDNNNTYLGNKLDELTNMYGDENIRRYEDFYIGMPENIKKLFSFFHFELNHLLKYMNGRLNNGHYTADESRSLIHLIEELKTIQSNVKGSQYDFELEPYYKRRLEDCEGFLQSSGGSTIPFDFEKINIIENEPVFRLRSLVSISRENNKVLFPTEEIGKGSYASVHRYKDEYYNRYFVIKKAFNNLTEKELERFKIEFEEMKKLNSPYVIEVYRFDEENQEYIMEFADTTLESYIFKNNATLKIRERIGLVRQILRAFIYINSKGVLHRDISTTNVLIKEYDGLNVVKVSDFGLVKRAVSNLTSIHTEFKGSLNDPNLDFIGFRNYGIRHETYALTRLIYFVMTGRKTLGTFENKEFEAFIIKGTSENLDERYNSVEELQRAFLSINEFQ